MHAQYKLVLRLTRKDGQHTQAIQAAQGLCHQCSNSRWKILWLQFVKLICASHYMSANCRHAQHQYLHLLLLLLLLLPGRPCAQGAVHLSQPEGV
jgi:hypothetical protein